MNRSSGPPKMEFTADEITQPGHLPTPERQLSERQLNATCTDEEIVPIWNSVRQDPEVKNALDTEKDLPDCRTVFGVKRIDLNADGNAEVLVNSPPCGAVGNCAFFVLGNSSNGLKVLLRSTDYIDAGEMGDQVLRTKTKGYRDILTKGHFNASVTRHTTYKFDGQKYVETNCKYEVPKSGHGEETKWGFVTCTDFSRWYDARYGN